MTIKHIRNIGVSLTVLAMLLVTGAVTAQAQVSRTSSTNIATQTRTSLYWGSSQTSEITDLQQKLKNIGYYTGTADGSFGRSTYEAVRKFQLDNRLVADGIAGSATVAALASAPSRAVALSSTLKPVSIAKVATVKPVTTRQPATSPSQCKVTTQVYSPSRDLGMAQLGLDTDEHPEILSYQILWWGGNWSPEYIPGENDVDTKLNYASTSTKDNGQRRRWSFFYDHTYAVTACAGSFNPVGSSKVDTSTKAPVSQLIGTPQGPAPTPAGLCEIEDLTITNSSNAYQSIYQTLVNAGFTPQQIAQVLPTMVGAGEMFNNGDELDLEWEAEGSTNNCDDVFEEDVHVQLSKLGNMAASSLFDFDNPALEDEAGEYGITSNPPAGFYRVYIESEEDPTINTVSEQIIYINGSSNLPAHPGCLEIRPNSSNSPQVISSASSQVAEFEIENVCDETVEFEAFDFKVISSYGVPQFDDIEVEIDGDDLSGDNDISVNFNSSIGGQDMYFSVDGDNFELDSGDEVDLVVYADVVGAYTPWNGSSQKSTAFAVALDDIDYEYEGDNFGWIGRPVWDNLVVVHYSN